MSLVTVGYFAKRMSVSEETVRRLVRSGLVPGKKRGKQWIIDSEEAMRVITERTNQQLRPIVFTGYTVYFIQAVDGGPIKIGVSTNVPRRLLELQLCCPCKLRILGVIPGCNPELEPEIHARFAALRLHGEWFTPAEGLFEYIQTAASPVLCNPAQEIRN